MDALEKKVAYLYRKQRKHHPYLYKDMMPLELADASSIGELCDLIPVKGSGIASITQEEWGELSINLDFMYQDVIDALRVQGYTLLYTTEIYAGYKVKYSFYKVPIR